jgi:CBS domain containing-hemolysin-like protein
MLTQLIIAVGLAIIISALCSVIEAVLFSTPRSHIELMIQSGKESGKILKRLKDDIHKPITAILTLNTVAHTMGAALAGAAAAVVLGEENLSWFSLIFTLAILLLSEIIPKTAGVTYYRQLAPVIAYPVNILIKILAPIIWLCHAVTKLIARKGEELTISADEVQIIATLSREAGAIDLQQEKVIYNILNLRNKNVRDVMTPRTVTFTLDESLSVEEAIEISSQENMYSRIPVYDRDIDDIIGIVLWKDVLLSAARKYSRRRLSILKTQVHFVPESSKLTSVLLEFFERRYHLFVVVDEYGTFTGIISLEDIIEEIVGQEIVDESDKTEDLRELARQQQRSL